MGVDIKVPEVGESITEVEIGEWLKSEGDRVEKDDPLVEIETEKATLEIPSPAAGILGKPLKARGDKASVGELIGSVAEGAGPEPSKAVREPDPPKEPERKRPEPRASEPVEDIPHRKPRIIQSSKRPPAGREPEHRPAPPARSPEPPAPRAGGDYSSREEEVVRMSALRRTIAKRLVQAQNDAALVTTYNEVDMTAVMELRSRYQEAFQKHHGTKLGIVSFFVMAAVEGLREIPELNAEIRGEEIVYHRYFDVGIAVGGGKGLVVPVLWDADGMTLAEIERSIKDLAERAQKKKLEPHELEGGTFTISNGGVYGSLLSTPIVKPPQSGVLGLHTIQKRPVVLEDQVVVRPMMYVALTYDHRIVDGREGVAFLRHVKDTIEKPSRLLLDI